MIVLPYGLICAVLHPAKFREVDIPVREIVTLAAVDSLCGRHQVPELVMGYVAPGDKVIQRQILRSHEPICINILYRGNVCFAAALLLLITIPAFSELILLSPVFLVHAQ